MATPHVAGVVALALAAKPQASPQGVLDFLIANSTQGTVGGAGTGSPNRLVYSMAAGAPSSPVVTKVAVTGIAGSAARTTRNWTATATATVQRIDAGNFAGPAAGATVTGSFSTGGSGSCVTGTNGSCAIRTTLKLSRTVTTFTVGSVSGPSMAYDASANTANNVTISLP